MMGLLLSLQSEVQAQRQRFESPSFAGKRSGRSPLCYVAVIGEVNRPGVYSTSSTDYPKLVEIIQQAGGPTDKASGNVRIVRHGKPAGQLFLSPGLREVLFSGDVVIVDGHRRGRTIAGSSGRQHSQQQEAPRGVAASDEPAVQIALVNLIERPVVLNNVPANLATKKGIASYLKQQPQVDQIRVIATNPSPFNQQQDSVAAEQLLNGTVLVFKESLVERANLPDDLPEAVQIDAPLPPGSEAANGSLHDTIGDNPKSIREDGPGRAHVAGLGTDQEASLSNLNRGALVLLPHGDASDTLLYPMPVDSNREREGLRAGDPSAFPQAEPGTELRDAEFAMVRPPGHASVSAPTDKPTAVAAITGESLSNRIDSTTLLVCLTGAVAAFAAFALLWTMARRVAVTASVPITQSGQARSSLDALINDELPLTEEPTQLPSRMKFYGRPAGRRKIRIDAGQQVGGPHFSHSPSAKATERQQYETANSASPGTASDQALPNSGPVADSGSRRARPMIHSPEQTSGLLDRVLTTIHGASRQ
jgi:hypothetical protein